MNNFEPNQSILSFGDDALESNPFADTTPTYSTQPITETEQEEQVVSTDLITEEPEPIQQNLEELSLEQESVEPESSIAETDTQVMYIYLAKEKG
jgi:hypothetical protein